MNCLFKNPPAPKVRRWDSLGADPIDSNNPLFTGTASAGSLHTGTTASTVTVSIRHGRNMGSTWGQLWPTRPQLGPDNLGPVGNSKLAFSRVVSTFFWSFFGIDYASCWAMFPMLCLHWAQLGAKLSPKGPKLRHFLHLGSIWIDLGPTSAQIAQLWAELGPKLGPLGAVWAQAVPAQDPVAHMNSTLRSNLPKLRDVGPQLGSSWSQLARVRRKLASWTQVGSCLAQLRPRTAKFDPSQLPRACFFPLCPIHWVRVVLVAKRLEYYKMVIFHSYLKLPECSNSMQ